MRTDLVLDTLNMAARARGRAGVTGDLRAQSRNDGAPRAASEGYKRPFVPEKRWPASAMAGQSDSSSETVATDPPPRDRPGRCTGEGMQTCL